MSELTTVLVDGLHGAHMESVLYGRYKSNLFEKQAPDWTYKPISYDLSDSEQFEAFSDSIAHNDLLLLVDNEFWQVEHHDGDIIAVHPSATWCDICEQYEKELPDHVTTYTISPWYLSALINGDYSGLEDHEAEKLDAWIAETTKGIKNYHWSYNADHKGDYEQCEITGYKGDSVELHLINMDYLENKK